MNETRRLPLDEILVNLTNHYAERNISVNSNKDKLNIDLAYHNFLWGFLDGDEGQIKKYVEMYERVKLYTLLEMLGE